MTNDLPHTSNADTGPASAETPDALGLGMDPKLQAGFEVDVTHEPDAAFLVLRIRLPRAGALSWLVKALTSYDGGMNRMGGVR